MKTTRFSLLLAALGIVLCSATTFAGTTITMTMDSYVPQTTYGVYAGTYGSMRPEVAALQSFTVTGSTDIRFASSGKLDLFCIELAQAITQGSTNTFDVLSSNEGSKGGLFNTSIGLLGANIPNAGIGATRAGNLALLYSYVFGSDYRPALVLHSNELKSSFQLAVWELAHDDNYDLKNASANGFYLSSGASASVVDQAQDWVAWVGNNPNATKMELLALHSGSMQDFIVPDPTKLSAIPEPSTYALLTGLGALGLAVLRRRFALVCC